MRLKWMSSYTSPFGLSLSKPPRVLSLSKGLSLSKPPRVLSLSKGLSLSKPCVHTSPFALSPSKRRAHGTGASKSSARTDRWEGLRA